MTLPRRIGRPLLCLALVAAGAACGADTDDPPGPAAATSPDTVGAAAAGETQPVLPVTIVDDSGRDVTVRSVDRIIPVNGDLAEVVFALGLGDQVVATDLSATFPPEADARPEIGYQRALQPEPILAFAPSVVLADELAGPPEVLDQLRGAGVAVVIVERDRTVDGPPAKVRAVGRALGVPARADSLATRIAGEMAQATAAASAGEPGARVLALYLRGTNVQLAFGKGSGIDALIQAAGGIDVGTELGIAESRPVTAESVIAARPDVVLVTTTGLESVGGVDGLLGIAAIARTPAGQHRRVLAYEDQYLYGFGPRTGQLLADLTRELTAPDVIGPTNPTS
jgi:iron complex transport system substrate-binding protein